LPAPPATSEEPRNGTILSAPAATPQPNRQREAVQSPPATARQDAASDRKRQRVRCAEIIERAQLGDLTSDDQAFLRSKCR
jgi:hypothetical protein